jgi:hypothetical protein
MYKPSKWHTWKEIIATTMINEYSLRNGVTHIIFTTGL